MYRLTAIFKHLQVVDVSVSPMNKIGIISLNQSSGQPRTGCEYGASLMRERGLINQLGCENEVNDFGDIELIEEYPEKVSYNSSGVCINNSWVVGQTSLKVFKKSIEVRKMGYIPVVVGSDHSIACGTVASALVNDPDVGIIWIDAHTDINTPETSLTMNLHGMPLSLLMKLVNPINISGFKWMYNVPILKPERLVYIGVRDIDPEELKIIKSLGIKAYTMDQIKIYGLDIIMNLALKHLQNKSKNIHVSWDIDSLDPLCAPSTGTCVSGGLSENEAIYIAKSLASTKSVISMDMVELNPLIGIDIADAYKTIDVANRIVRTVFS